MRPPAAFLRQTVWMRLAVATAAWLALTSAALAQRPGGTPRPADPRPATEPGVSALPDAPAPDTLGRDTARVERIVLRARRAGRTVTLRWAPGTPALWLAANDSGYVVERIVPARERGGAARRTRLTPQPLRPMPLERFRQHAGADDRYAAVAAQMLYGQSSIPEAQSPGFDLILRSADLTNRHGFALFAADLSAAAADGLALRFVDDAAPEGLVLYTVRMAHPALGEADTALARPGPAAASVAVPSGDTPAALAPDGFEVQAGDGVVRLRWSPGEPGRAFTAFRLARRDGSTGAFVPLHTSPLAAVTTPEQPYVVFTDSTAQNYRRYTYRLVGLDAFGAASAPAELVAMARDLTPPPAPTLTRTAHLRESTVQIEWTPADGPPAPDLRGYRVGVASHPDGPFLYTPDVLPPSARSATDSRALSGEPNYYTVAAVDTAGNAAPALARFVQLVDSVGPSVPTRLAYDARALEGRNGLVTLRWRVPPEPDLLGFRVYRANERGHAFALDSRALVQDTTYADTLDVQTLTRTIYYRVVALDRNYNPSDTTAVVRVVLPDIVPPGAPVFADATPTDSTVTLAWFRSPSDDVARQVLRRATAPDTTWTDLAALAPSDSLYTDRAVARGTRYRYTLVAVDSTGLSSAPATPVQARPYDTGVRPGISALRAEATDTGARLTWQPPPGGGDFWYVVYRADAPDAPLRRVANTRQTAEANEQLPAGTYRFAVQVLHRDGGASLLSTPTTVEVVPRRR